MLCPGARYGACSASNGLLMFPHVQATGGKHGKIGSISPARTLVDVCGPAPYTVQKVFAQAPTGTSWPFNWHRRLPTTLFKTCQQD